MYKNRDEKIKTDSTYADVQDHQWDQIHEWDESKLN